jgi:hypothetical protein
VLDGWIYYRKWCDTNASDGIYKMRTDSSLEQRLTDNKGRYINLAGDWIYYINDPAGDIWRIKTDGSHSQKLYPGRYAYLTTDGECLYFGLYDDSLFIGSCDGQQPIKNLPGKFRDPFVYGDWIYYRTVHDDICRMDKDDFKIDTIVERKYHQGGIYIPGKESFLLGDNGIFKFNIREKKMDTLSTIYVSTLGMRENYIFFTTDEHDENYKPYNKAFCMTFDSLKKRKDPKNWLQTYDESVKYYKDSVQRFINCIKNNDRIGLSKLIHFPLSRYYPLPSIKTADEFLDRFDEVFDKKLTCIISKSDINKDWVGMGWRGVMLQRGILWLEYDGKLTGTNYETETEKRKRTELINTERNTLHSSLQVYLEPVLEWKTKKYRIRIDDLGKYKYRYASWPVNKLPNDKPDLIINDGTCTPDGNGGNEIYEFKKGIYLYRCYVRKLRSWDEPPGRLEVYENEECILNEPVIESSYSN